MQNWWSLSDKRGNVFKNLKQVFKSCRLVSLSHVDSVATDQHLWAKAIFGHYNNMMIIYYYYLQSFLCVTQQCFFFVIVFSGTCTVQLQREETHVNTRVRPRPSMTTWVCTGVSFLALYSTVGISDKLKLRTISLSYLPIHYLAVIWLQLVFTTL